VESRCQSASVRLAARRGLILFGTLCALMVACDGESPTSSAESTITRLTGTITATADSTHVVTLNDTGNLRLTLDEVRPILLDVTTVDPSQLSFLLSLGNFSSGACDYTYSAGFARGSVASFGLIKGDYCVTLSDSDLPEESSVAYTMTATVSD
jgi:hypothetical protein